MKKINVIILLLMLTLFMPVTVKADMGAPMSSYKVRVDKKEGAPIYKWDSKTEAYEKTSKVLDYDTILTIVYEYINDNILYADAYYETIDEQVTIRLSDFAPTDVKLSDYKHDTSSKYYVFDDTCYLYKGPSEMYGKVSPETKLSVGTIIESKYFDDLWIYVEQNGVKGWAYKYTYDLSIYDEPAGMAQIDYYEPQKIKTVKKVSMYKSPKTEESLDITIPENTELETIYEYSKNPREPYYYVKYNGTYGWIETTFEEGIMQGSFINNIIYYKKVELEVTNSNGVILYETFNSNKNKITTIPAGTKLTAYYHASGSYAMDWYQVEYDGKIGWIDGSEYDNVSQEENNDETNVPEDNEVTDNKENNNNVPDKEENNSINTIILYCVSAAMIISLTALVTTILINKKKKDNNDNKEKSVK